MAPLTFHCPYCQSRLHVPATAAGTAGPCPCCGRQVTAPPFDPFQPFPITTPPVSAGPPDNVSASLPFSGLPTPPPSSEPIPPGDPRPFFRPPSPPPPPSPFAEPETPAQLSISTPPVAPEITAPIEPAVDTALPPEPPPLPAPAPSNHPVEPEANVPAPVESLAPSSSDHPFEGFDPSRPAPAPPEPIEEPKPATATSPRSTTIPTTLEIPALGRLRWAVMLLACLVFFMLGLLAGQALTLTRLSSASPIFLTPGPSLNVPAPPPPSSEPALAASSPTHRKSPADPPRPLPDLSASELPDLPPLPDPAPAAPVSADPSRLALEAFLDAPRWDQRVPFLLPQTPSADDPESSDLASEASALSDGPIAYTRIEGPILLPGLHFFQVFTPTLPKGFPVPMIERDGSWKLDGRLFLEFHDDWFYQFAAGRRGSQGEFHLQIKPRGQGDGRFIPYQLTAPIEGRSFGGFAREGSLAQTLLDSLFHGDSKDDAELQHLISGDGVPVVAQLSCRETASGKRFLVIENVRVRGWGPEA